MKIGILQTGHVPEPLVAKHGTYPSMFEKLLEGSGFEFETFVVVDNEFPESIHSCDGWLITGSRHGTYEDHDFIAPLENFIREAYAAGVPLAGICFGHQIMAQALGGKVEKYTGGWGLGRTKYKIGIKDLELMAMHQDQVVEKPADAEVIASTDFCTYAGLSYKGKAISLQPHPEFTPEYTRDLIKMRSGTVFTKEQADEALEALENEANNSPEIAAQLAEFFKNALAEKAA